MSSPEGRFFAKVNKDGPFNERLGSRCWIWTGAVDGGGYGTFTAGGRFIGAHRWSYMHHVGPIADGHEVDHRCFVHGCVNPEHLRSGTRSQNHENLRGPSARSSSGVRGVYWNKGAWTAYVKKSGRMIYAGRYKTIEEAEKAVIAKRNELFEWNDLDRVNDS